MLYIITIYNTETEIGIVHTTRYPEEIDEYESCLEECEIMFVNEVNGL